MFVSFSILVSSGTDVDDVQPTCEPRMKSRSVNAPAEGDHVT